MKRSKPLNWKIVAGIVVVCLALGIVFDQVMLGHKASSVERVNKVDPELQAASKQAQDGLPNFIKELQDPKPGQGFAIKGGFKTASGLEYLWVKSPVFKDGEFAGKLDQTPMAYSGKKGDIVRVPLKDVYDWLIKDDSGVRGMFTDKVLQKRAGQ